jgi:glycosyltransferase involved in cell wall biosynthesis
MSLIIHAPNVHQGGGKTLLVELLRAIDENYPCTLLADARLDLSFAPKNIRILSFRPTVWGRLGAERRLRELAHPQDTVLCMGNLPPLLPCAGHIIVFLQNRYLLGDVSLEGMPKKTRLRISVERTWLRRRLLRGVELVVQTTSMQHAAKEALGVVPRVMPFCAYQNSTQSSRGGQTARFIYPATADKHKNHKNLLAAWSLLSESRIEAELHLTVDGNAEILRAIARLRHSGARIVNHGQLTPQQLNELYGACSALIFPSYMESFGLPLLEAQAFGLPIIASERDYVRDVVVPVQTFDPQSAISIARAVRRFLNLPEEPVIPMRPSDFLREVMRNGEAENQPD